MKRENTRLKLEYEIDDGPPIQALGTIAGREFYFHSKHSNWSFEVANDLGDLPTDVGGESVFHLQSRHNNAGRMPLGEACEIVERCAEFFLAVTAARLKAATETPNEKQRNRKLPNPKKGRSLEEAMKKTNQQYAKTLAKLAKS